MLTSRENVSWVCTNRFLFLITSRRIPVFQFVELNDRSQLSFFNRSTGVNPSSPVEKVLDTEFLFKQQTFRIISHVMHLIVKDCFLKCNYLLVGISHSNYYTTEYLRVHHPLPRTKMKKYIIFNLYRK